MENKKKTNWNELTLKETQMKMKLLY